MKLFKNTQTVLLLVSLLTFTGAYSQKSIKKTLSAGDAAMEKKDYATAIDYYRNVLNVDSLTMEHQFKYAEASRLGYDGENALRWYKKVYNIDKGKEHPLVPFYIGMELRTEGKSKDAKKYLDKFIKTHAKKPKDNLKEALLKAKRESEAIEKAEDIMSFPTNDVVVHLDSMVNSKVSEYAPFEHDSILYFSSLRDKKVKDKSGVGFSKLYVATQVPVVENKFLKAIEVDTTLNKEGIHNANTSFSPDQSKLLVSRCKLVHSNKYACEIYMSEFSNGKWSTLKVLPSPINLKGTNNSQPNFSTIDNKVVMFFASDRDGGQGQMDIWYSFMKEDGTFEEPINAGKQINTVEDDITPWYAVDKGKLFFSSTYHMGLGNFDIFSSEYKDGKFAAPANMGYPINSSFNDIYYSVNLKKDKAYISSNRTGSYFEHKPNCCNDIYTFPIPKVVEPIDTPKVMIEKMQVLCPLTLYFHNDEPDKKTMSKITTINYMKSYEDYSAMIPEYQKRWSSGANDSMAEIAISQVDNFFEDSAAAGVRDLRKFTLLLDSVLKMGHRVEITIQGFCSPLASTEYNTNLAKRRIVSLQNYFREYNNGVFAKYINNTVKGVGTITYKEVQIGELPTSIQSPDYDNTKESIYNPLTARERKIQIIAVGYLSNE